MSRALASWLQLLRIALAPTLLWDVLAGAALAGVPFDGRVAYAVAAGLLVYHAGMVLNDVADRRLDARHRPERPIPSGRVSAPAAAAVGVLMLAAACGLAWLRLPPLAARLVLALAAIVLLYDLGGAAIRLSLGPGLLALARAGSLALGGVALLELRPLVDQVTPWPFAVYGVYFLFTSRLATREERGTSGVRALPYVVAAAASPLLLANAGAAWYFFPAALLFGLWLIVPALHDRHGMWPPERVQQAVRRGLSGAPLVPGLALAAAGQPLGLLGGLAVHLVVRSLARHFAPE